MKPTSTELGTPQPHAHQPAKCPNCRAPLDSVCGVGHDAQIRDGDMAVCRKCACLLRFWTGPPRYEPLPADVFLDIDPATRHQLTSTRRAVLDHLNRKRKRRQK